MDRARESAKQAYGSAAGAARERYTAASDAARKQYESVRGRIEEAEMGEWLERTRQYVRDNPGKALLISVGIGFLVGLLL
ncbi:MAG TPA: hypothetical protein VM534_03445, partial [Thermoanaerobaculia bacterium]|nr:hypothetical protein [Thermoanaerobaculia bacterium]